MKNYFAKICRAITVSLLVAGTQLTLAYTENFDSCPSNSNIIGEGGWKGWDNDSTLGASVVNTFAVNNPNSVRITRLSDVVKSFSGFTSDKWTFRAMQYVPST